MNDAILNKKESIERCIRQIRKYYSLMNNLIAMVGFRNILVHQYQAIDLQIMKNVIENHLDEWVDFTNLMITLIEDQTS